MDFYSHSPMALIPLQKRPPDSQWVIDWVSPRFCLVPNRLVWQCAQDLYVGDAWFDSQLEYLLF